MKGYDTGITSEVFTVKSNLTVEDIMKIVSLMKCKATIEWINSLDTKIENSVIIGAYLTGIELAKYLKKFSSTTTIEIYPHIKEIIENDIEFDSNLKKIKDADLVVDTTGLGGLKPEKAKLINGDIFLVEDPTSDGSDIIIKGRSDIIERLKYSKSKYKGILKTYGLNSKTSGTMTITIEILRKSMVDILKRPGVLYAVAGMDFYEKVLFREKNVDKFLYLIRKPAVTFSTLIPFNPDEIINDHIKSIISMVENVSFQTF